MEEKEKEQVGEKEQKPRCTKCASSFIYIRIRDNQRVCRSCGNVENLGEKK